MAAVVDIAAAVAVVVLHRVDMVVVDTQEGAVGQQVVVVPCPQDDPVHIASHSSYAGLGVPAVAAVAVVVLRFPLNLLYRYPLNAFNAFFCSCPIPLS